MTGTNSFLTAASTRKIKECWELGVKYDDYDEFIIFVIDANDLKIRNCPNEVKLGKLKFSVSLFMIPFFAIWEVFKHSKVSSFFGEMNKLSQL